MSCKRIANSLFVCTQLNSFKYCNSASIILFHSNNNPLYMIWPIDGTIWSIDGTPTSTDTPGQSGPGCNEGVLQIPERSRIGVSPSDSFVSYSEHSFREGAEFLLFCRNVVGVFYSPLFTGLKIFWFTLVIIQIQNLLTFFGLYLFPLIFAFFFIETYEELICSSNKLMSC